MQIFNTNIDRLAALLLLTFLRVERALKLFLNAFLYPFKKILHDQTTFRDNNIYGLGITGQICFLEKALNDRFDKYPRRIYITDGVLRDVPYVYSQNEHTPLYIYTGAENEPLYIYQRTEDGFVAGNSFIVHVPELLLPTDLMQRATALNEIANFTNIYKLASRRFGIEIVPTI
jgi:hypothetical protein